MPAVVVTDALPSIGILPHHPGGHGASETIQRIVKALVRDAFKGLGYGRIQASLDSGVLQDSRSFLRNQTAQVSLIFPNRLLTKLPSSLWLLLVGDTFLQSKEAYVDRVRKNFNHHWSTLIATKQGIRITCESARHECLTEINTRLPPIAYCCVR